MGAPDAKALKQQLIVELKAAILRAERAYGGVARSRLAKSLSISTASVYAYLKGTTLPSAEVFDRMLIELKVAPMDAKHLVALRDSVEIANRSESVQSRDRRTPVPTAELPRDVEVLHGRQAELDQIRTLLTREREGIAVCVVSGLGGVGKTALAVRTARSLGTAFADGCLFVNLQGYAAEPVMSAAEAADKLLRQLAVPIESIPAHADQRIALLRAQLRDKHLLLVLDNALDTAQVAPLLPSDGHYAVLITSRSNLNALDDVGRIRIAPLTVRATSLLLAELIADLPPGRSPADSVRESIAAQCHGLPVAVRIAAAVLRSESWPLPVIDGDAPVELGVFHDGERGIESLFEYSAARLPTELTQTFALLGLHCGPAFDVEAAAALADIDHNVVRCQLRQLIEANLLEAPNPGRYAFHDLVRAFAYQRAETGLAPLAATQAGSRLVDHYLTRVDAADRLLTPHRHREGMTPAPCRYLYRYADYQDALRGLTTDRDNIAGAARSAFDHGLDEQCWQIAFALRGFVFIANDVDLWIGTHELALTATQRAGNLYAEAVTRNNLGLALLTRGDDIAAAQMYEKARALFTRIGDPHGEHTTIAHQAWIHFHRGEYDQALRNSIEALTYLTKFGTPRNTAILLRDTALIEIALGEYLDAVPKLLEALEMFKAFGLHVDEAMAHNVLGTAYQRLGALALAYEAFEHAADLANDAQSVLERARGHDGMGTIAATQQDWPLAQHHWQQALSDFEELHDTLRTETIAARLDEISMR
ncbi:MAG: hypothetical protein JWN03_862 [Nocardia sp.]|uniref:tetratricopeptide repeat protein n=1 Tax=Nocardia sp. TaxID=1821 RepID=UPI002627F205|nr:tetratricopeptide repeat protein [Nocardia sp.]MCU1640587.1 hypothetical protein [Nocardia sp.]